MEINGRDILIGIGVGAVILYFIGKSRQTLSTPLSTPLSTLSTSTIPNQEYHLDNNTQIRNPYPSCNTLTIKNDIDVINSSIVICDSPIISTCTTIPTSCPVANPTQYINMMAIVRTMVAENNVPIDFDYVLDGIPTTTNVVVSLGTGNNTIFAFPTNVRFPSNTSLTLFGARIVNSLEPREKHKPKEYGQGYEQEYGGYYDYYYRQKMYGFMS